MTFEQLIEDVTTRGRYVLAYIDHDGNMREVLLKDGPLADAYVAKHCVAGRGCVLFRLFTHERRDPRSEAEAG